MFVDRVSIKGYRAIKELEFEANRINVIVGPNNTGKSSILEAIGLATTVSSGFKDRLGSNILEYLLERRKYDPRYLIRMGEKSARIEVRAEGNDYMLVLEYLHGLPQDARGFLIRNYFSERVLKDVLEEITETESEEFRVRLREALEDFSAYISHEFNLDSRKIEYLVSRTLRKYGWNRRSTEISSDNLNRIKERIISEVARTPKVIISVESPLDELLGLYLYASRNIRRSIMEILIEELKLRRMKEPFLILPLLSGKGWWLYTISDLKIKPEMRTILGFWRGLLEIQSEKLYDIAVHEGKIEELLGFMRECISYVRDIRKTERGIQVITDAKKPVPMSSMGDGFAALFKLSFLVSLVDEGVVILEEPEISLHPYFMNVIVHRILKSSGNVQFFISTHSFDFLRNLLEEAHDQNLLDRINVIRMQRREDLGEVVGYPMSGEMAREELEEIGIDLRYT